MPRPFGYKHTAETRAKMSKDIWERLTPKVIPTDGCWFWIAQKDKLGYGRIAAGGHFGRPLLAHRVVYEHLRGPIPEGLELDHLCRNPSCVNPAHLEAVTHKVNVLRGENHVAKNAQKTHCANGHPYTSENTYVRANGNRQCRACGRVHDRKRRPLRRQEMSRYQKAYRDRMRERKEA